MSGRLSGNVCVVTGTGGSVGRATALAFARGPGVGERYARQDAAGRLGRPGQVASLAPFLASAESSYVTGVDIVVDGGMKVW